MIFQHDDASTTPSATRFSLSTRIGRRAPKGAAALLLTASAAAMATTMMVGSARADCDFPTNGDDTLTCDADFGGGFGVNALDGNDTVNITGGTYTNTITGGNGQDTITLNAGTLQMAIMGQGNNDVINLNGGTVDSVLGDGPDDGDGGGENDQFEIFVVFIPEPPGADTITLDGATVVNDIHGNEEDDTITLLSGSVGGTVYGDDGNDTITLNGASIGVNVIAGSGNDVVTVETGSIGLSLLADIGDDTVTLNGGSIAGFVSGDAGNDTITLNGATVGSLILGNDGNDIIDLLSGSSNLVSGGAGNDTITLAGASLTSGISGSDGVDIINLTSGSATSVDGGLGNDTMTLDGASIAGVVKGGEGNDSITLNSGSATTVEGNNGMDTILLAGATVSGNILGQGLSDTITLNSGSVGGDVYGDGPDFIDGFVDLPGADSITLNGAMVAGTIYGNEEADTIGLLAGSALTVAGGTGNDMVTLNGASITGYISGEDGNDNITLLGGSAGEVTGDAGNDIVTLNGASIGGMISGNEGDDTFDLVSGSFGGNVEGGDGSDDATVRSTFNLATITGNLDGGDDVTNGDGFFDALTILASGTLTGEQLLNWEQIDVDGGSTLLLEGASLVTSVEDGDGIRILSASTLDLDDGLAITGDLTIFGGSTLRADTPGGTGVYSVSDDLNNFGLIDLSDGLGAGDTLTVGGNYASASDLHLDVALNATEAGDSLVIGGSISGAPTLITFTDTDPFGPPSFTGAGPGNGILVVDNSAGMDIVEGDFVMDPIAHPDDEIVKGPFFYTLSLEADDILYLQSDVLPQIYGYAILTELMREEFPILRERLGDRRYNGNGAPEPVLADTDNGGIWARIEGRGRDIEHSGGFDTGEWEASRGEAEVGVDIPMDVGGGVGVFGVSTHFVQGFADANSGLTTDPDIAEIDTTGFGAGLSFAWFPGGGFYADVQGRLTAWDADVEVDNRGLKQDVNAIGWGTSLEVGNRLQMTPSATLTPRGQVVYTDVNFSDFTDDDGVDVSQDESASVVIEAGVTLEQMFADNGVAMVFDASINHDVLGDSSIDASGFTFDSGLEDTWTTFGMGAVMETGEGTSAYIQAELGTPVGSSFGDSIGYALRAGVRVDF